MASLAPKQRLFRIKDLYRHKALSGLTATADGRQVAWAAAQADLQTNKTISEIWSWTPEAGQSQVTFGGSASAPCFSPQGNRLAFLSDRGGRKQQVLVMGLHLCEGRQVTGFEEGVISFKWSPGGRHVAVIAVADKTPEEKKRDEESKDWRTVDADERRRQLWIVSAAGRGKPRRISRGGEHVSSVAWTPDGKHLVYIACPLASINSQWYESSLIVASPAGRGRRKVCEVGGHAVESAMSVSADGKRLLMCQPYGDRDRWHDVAMIVDLKTGRKRRAVPRFNFKQMNNQWLGDGGIIFESDIGTSFRIGLAGPGGKVRTLDTGDGVAGFAVPAPKASRVFYLYSQPDRADEVYSIPLDGAGKPEQISHQNKHIESIRLAKAEAVRWKADDGLQIEGILYLPTKPGARKPYPLIVMPHGGPYNSSAASYGGSLVANIYCAAGYACLLPNFRGSTGRGRIFTRKIVGDWGDGPFGDIMAGVDHLVRRGMVNGKRMAIFGGSFGGYMTTWSVGHTRRFRCAVAVAAVTNNLSMWGVTDIPGFQLYSCGGVLPNFTGSYWREQSPLHHVDKVRTPTLIITGELDQRVPPSQSHEFYRALKYRGVETRLVIYPREPHAVSEPRHRLHYFKLILDWINEHTLGQRSRR